jgi:tetratricopeptide (TPR) repeat protein
MRLLTKVLSESASRAAERQVATRGEIPRARPSPIDAAERARVISAAGSDVAAGRYANALASIDGALDAAPGDFELVFARASTLFSWGRYSEARTAHINAEQLGLRSGALYAQWGWASHWIGRSDEALDLMRKAVAAQPDDWTTHFGLAAMLRSAKQLDASLASTKRALELNPDELYCLAGLVACEVDLGQLEEAEGHARHAIELRPESSTVWSNLGGVLDHQNRYDEALAAYKRAEEFEALSPESPDDYFNCVICLLRCARTHEALAMLEDKLPKYADARAQSHYALALLTSGRMADGWSQYEFRWMKEPLASWRPNFAKPVWAGQDLRGKTILLRTEQGHGDFIQFIRYASRIKALGAKVLVQLREEVRGLAALLPEVDQILTPNEPYPPFDFYVNLMSIPWVFGTDLSTVPAEVPYLQADPDRTAGWASRLRHEGTLNVGLVWAGSPTHPRDAARSLTLQRLAALARIAGVRFHFLQKGPAAAEAATPPEGMSFVDLGPDLQDYGDTAAVIGQMDLILGVDTSVVHLAGALAKPVWVLLPKPADWRWLEEREDTPWYPTMRLFRQRRQDDWDEVIDRVTRELKAWVDEPRGPSPKVEEHVSAGASALPQQAVALTAPHHIRGLSQVAQTRIGYLQYFPDQPWIGKSIEWYGEHTQLQLELLARMGIAGSTVLEAGAGVGYHALWLAAAVGPTGHLFLYEDDDLLKRALRQNLTTNNVLNATVMRRLLGRSGNSESPALVLRVGAEDPDPATIAQEPRETIDELRLQRLDWLKINDGIGALDVLVGASETLWRLRSKLFIGTPDDDSLQRLATHAQDMGYSCWKTRTPWFNLANFNLRETDIFDGRTSLTLLAIPEESALEVTLDGCERIA